jgi:hypothetical protein
MPLLLVASMAFAQQTKTAPTKPAKTEQHLKADGTPDKRYKENKTATKKETVHTKKDGTPDKRYKENKDAKKPTATKKS